MRTCPEMSRGIFLHSFHPLRRDEWPGVTHFQEAFLELNFKKSPILSLFSFKCLSEEKHSPDIHQVRMRFVLLHMRSNVVQQKELWSKTRSHGMPTLGSQFPLLQGYDRAPRESTFDKCLLSRYINRQKVYLFIIFSLHLLVCFLVLDFKVHESRILPDLPLLCPQHVKQSKT